MAHNVRVEVDNVQVAGANHDSGTTVTISDEEYDALAAADRFTDGTLTDLGVSGEGGDEIYDQTAAPALTSTVAAAATPTKAEFDALRADLVALRTALTGPGKPFA